MNKLINRTEAKLAFINTFINTLGDVADWEHNGIVIELDAPTGHCVCGHAIKFEFIIVNTKNGKQSQVGSECINHFKDYNINLFNSLTATITRIEAEEKAMKEMMLDKEIEPIKAEYEAKRQKLREYYIANYPNRAYCPDYALYMAVCSSKGFKKEPAKSFKSKKVLLNWYIKNNKNISSFISDKGI